MTPILETKLIEQALTQAKTQLKAQATNEVFFNEFVLPLTLVQISGNTLVLEAKNLFAQQILTNDYAVSLVSAINTILKSNFQIKFIVKGATVGSLHSDNVHNDNFVNPSAVKARSINPNYIFDNFIVSEFNKAAYNAAQSLFKQKFWNPIFLSGGVGLGKTHLLHAIGNEYIKRFPEKNIRYVTTDEFVREMYNGISHGDNEVEHLKDRYQAYDLLLIDDIQFLSKKDKANEIFFNILNNNVSRNQIIVMTSDKAPSQLEHFEDRMKSRFHSGLVIQITQPDLNAIKTILQEKIKESGEGFQFTKEATDYIAHRNNHDIRHLEGFLHKVLFYALNNLPPRAVITLNVITGSVEQERQDAMRDLGYDVDPNVVIAQICAAYNIDPHIVKSKARTRQATMVRHVCMYVLRQKLNMPYAQIGSYFSGRDHSTIMDSIQKIENMIKKDEELKNFILNLCKKI